MICSDVTATVLNVKKMIAKEDPIVSKKLEVVSRVVYKDGTIKNVADLNPEEKQRLAIHLDSAPARALGYNYTVSFKDEER